MKKIVVAMAAGLTALQVMDLWTTWNFLEAGHREANPLSAWMLEEWGFIALVFAKLWAMAAAGLLVYVGLAYTEKRLPMARGKVVAAYAFMAVLVGFEYAWVIHNNAGLVA